MVARFVTTLILLLLALYAFADGVLDGGHVFNPSGIAFLILSGAVWFGWDAVRAAFVTARDESNIPIIRLGSAIIRGMRRTPQPHRSSDEAA
ncbi:MAG TPA: hypothetical protein VK432_00265 [Stellaceae bacterium]|nr:hypothetical protein [Stellaceae bacterium]